MICPLSRIILFHSRFVYNLSSLARYRYETRSLLMHYKPAMLHGMAILVQQWFVDTRRLSYGSRRGKHSHIQYALRRT